MIKSNQVETALVEAAKLIGPQCVEGGDGHFLVTFTRDESVELLYDEPAQCVTFMAKLGRLDQNRAATSQRILLEYSFIHTATGGITMALDPVSGQVIQMFRWPVGHLSVQEFSTILRNFNHKACLWREAIAAGLGSGSEPEQALNNDDFDIHTAIRV